jgi:hypothetical protein
VKLKTEKLVSKSNVLCLWSNVYCLKKIAADFSYPSPNLSPQGRGFILYSVFSPSLVERGWGGEVICEEKFEDRMENGEPKVAF